MENLEKIKALIIDKTGVDASKVSDTIDIFEDLGCVGDDFHELIEDYAKEFKVDMSNYLWYFHGDEEGSLNSIGGWFFKRPFERVKRIPVTPNMLLEFAEAKKWNIQYPYHNIPKVRVDIIINYALAGLFLFLLIRWFI